MHPVVRWARYLITFRAFRNLALMDLMWWIQEWLECNRRSKNLKKCERGIGVLDKSRGGKKEVDFVLWKIMRLNLDDDGRKPWLESQIEIEAIIN